MNLHINPFPSYISKKNIHLFILVSIVLYLTQSIVKKFIILELKYILNII